MDRRAISFVLISTAVIFAWISIEPLIFPPAPPAPKPPVAENPEADPAGEGQEIAAADSNASPDDEAATATAAPFEPKSQLVSLGSLAADSPYRMLATFDSQGAAIRRVELSDRLASGKFRFKHVDDRAGYLGHLEAIDAENGGAAVRFVPPGSPAALAQSGSSADIGLRVGDVIERVGDQAIAGATALLRRLDQTRPGEELQLAVRRDGKELVYAATLSERPMEVIQTFPELEADPEFQHRQSFVTRFGGMTNGLWREIGPDLETRDWVIDPQDDPDQLTFRYELTSADLEKAKLQGPITILKRYRLARRDAGGAVESKRGSSERFDRTYHLEMEIEMRSFATETQNVGLQIAGPSGLPEEGWWYINKIHARSTAFFYTAGTRDVVGASEGLGFRFLGGPEIVSNSLTEGNAPLELFPQGLDPTARQMLYAGIDTQYFNVSLLPNRQEGAPPFACFSAIAEPVEDLNKLESKLRRKADLSFRLTTEPIALAPYNAETGEGAHRLAFTIFAGPKFPELLDYYGLGDTVSYGWFAMFSKPLLWILHTFHAIVGNYGLAIVMLTILVRAAMIPISRKAALNAQMMQYLQPEMKKIAEQYKEDMEKRARAQQDLFRKYRYNPMGGCLLMFLQLPIFLGLYRGLAVDIELRDQGAIPGLDWCSNLAGPDRLFRWADWLPFVTSETGWLGPYFNVLPIVTIGLFLVQQKLFMPPALDDQMRATQKMMTFMMVFMGFLFFKVPAGLCIYFITSSIWGIVERKLLPKPSLDGKLAVIESNGTASSDAAPRERSSAQARLDELRKRNRKRR